MANIVDVQNMQKDLEGGLVQKMAEFENRLKAATTPTSTTLSQLRDEFYSFKDSVTFMLNLMQQQIQNCVKSIDAINMHHRKKALLLTGFLESPTTDLKHEVLLLLHDKLGLTNISQSSIHHCFRLGVQQNSRPRPVVVFFSDHQSKSQVWNSKSKLKGSSISVGEFLTKIRQSVYRGARNHFGIKNVWTLDGAIHIKHSEGRTKICSQEELSALIAKFPTGSPASSDKTTQNNNKTPNSSDTNAIQPKHTSPLSSQVGRVRRQQASTVIQDDIKRSKRVAVKK